MNNISKTWVYNKVIPGGETLASGKRAAEETTMAGWK